MFPLVSDNLGVAHEAAGAIEEAGDCALRALLLRRRLLPPGHIDLATSLSNMGEVCIRQHRYGEAFSLHAEALRVRNVAAGC